MRLAQRLTVLLVVLLGMFATNLAAATVEALYIEETNTTIHNSTEYGIQSAGYPVALHVGTLTISSVGSGAKPFMYKIRLKRSGNYGGGKEYELESTKKINNQDEFGAQLVAKVTFGSTTIVKTINWSSGEDPLMGDTDFQDRPYPITIEFYLGIRNINNAGQATGAGFQFEDDDGPNLANFTVQYKTTNGWQGSHQDIPFSGHSGPMPFFSTNYNEDSPNRLNGVIFDPTVFVSLLIEQTPSEKTISLPNASGTSRAKVGVARVSLSGNKRPSPQGVSITFTDSNGSPSIGFRLKHEGLSSFIPFTLYLAGSPVGYGTPITWPNLTYGSNNLKDLHVGGVDLQNSALGMGGTYSDTIYVTIVPLDSNMVGL